MRYFRDIMGMPVQLEIVDATHQDTIAETVFAYLRSVDARFSPYKIESEVSRINRGEIEQADWSDEMREVLELAERTRVETQGAFNIRQPNGALDPSGLVKGWAMRNAVEILKRNGIENFYLEIAGDMQTHGVDSGGTPWRIGILNPITQREIVKIIEPRECGVATSGTYLRGAHIYDPVRGETASSPYLSITVIGPDIYDADRMATAAFAMGERALPFLASLDGYEGYAIARDGIATKTNGFASYEVHR